jgi:Zn-dependent protease with chaperone function
MLAPFVGGLLIAAPVAAAAVYLSKKGLAGLVNVVHTEMFEKKENNNFIHLDLKTGHGRVRWHGIVGDRHKSFPEEYEKLIKMAGLKEMPRILIIDQIFKRNAKSRLSGMISDYMAATTSRPDGGKPVVMLGKGAIAELTPEELRGVVAHELTHLALAHPAKNVGWMAQMPLNGVLNAALLGVAVFGPLPVLPIVGAIVGLNLLDRTLKSLKSRHKEEMADRGAALLTGGTKALGTALEKIKQAMTKYRKIEIEEEFRALGKQPPDPKHPYFRLKNWWRMTVDGTHPPNEKRSMLLEKFEERHKTFCQRRQGEFTALFNAAAKPAQAPGNINKPAEPPAAAGPKAA